METRTITIYEFHELSEKAKDRARYDYKAAEGYIDEDEAMESLKKLAEHFGAKLKTWEIDFFNGMYSSAEFRIPGGMDRETIGDLLDELGEYNPDTLKGLGECKLTGVCHDEDAIDGFRKAFMAGESDLEDLLEAAFREWLKICQSDCEEFYGDECFSEHCDANEYRFHENGEMA